MKKLLLFLLVLAGGVSTASAWGDLYLICPQNNNWSNTSFSDDFKFSCLEENHFRATIPGSYVKTSNFQFRFRDKDSNTWMNISPESNTADAEITTNSTYSTDWQNSNSRCFYIAQNANAKYVHIYCNWNTSTNKWDISCAYVTEQNTYNVAYSNPTNWPNVYVYAYLDGVRLTDSWPGTPINLTDGVYKATITAASSSKVIFNNGSSGNDNQSWTMELENDAIYNFQGKISDQLVSINQYGMATFCSQYPLDFSTATPVGLKAYKITASNKATGELTKEEVTKVPAGVGVYLEGSKSTNYAVSCTATATSIGDNMLVGVTVDTPISQTVDDNTNYILTVNKDGGDVLTPKFFKVNTAGNTVGANKAYLQIPTANAAREYFWFDDEATGINAAKVSQPAGEIFDLQGRRVAQPTKGLYIVNGKKYFAK